MGKKRAMLFVDGQNLMMGARSFEKGGFDYDVITLTEKLTEDYDFIRGYWFDSHKPDQRSSKQGFYTFLQTNGFRVESTELNVSEDGAKEKEADIRLATEMIACGFNDSYDIAIVITGDRDFLKAIRYVQDQGKVVHVAAFKEPMSGKLKREADGYTYIDDIAEDVRK